MNVSCRPHRITVVAGARHAKVSQRNRRRAVCVSHAVAPEVSSYQMSRDETKAALLDSFWGTERGMSATSETRAEIIELITQLEAVNPCESPTETTEQLDGTWKLLYTSNSELLAILALGKLPFVTIEDIQQTINFAAGVVTNTVTILSPVSRSAVSSTADAAVESPKRLNLTFQKTTLAPPELLTDSELPDSTMVMGQSVDLRTVKSALQPVRDASKDVLDMVANLLRQQPDLNIPISSSKERPSTWLLTTYLDDSLRVSRGDGGSIYILTKDSPQIYPPAPSEAEAAAAPVASGSAATSIEAPSTTSMMPADDESAGSSESKTSEAVLDTEVGTASVQAPAGRIEVVAEGADGVSSAASSDLKKGSSKKGKKGKD